MAILSDSIQNVYNIKRIEFEEYNINNRSLWSGIDESVKKEILSDADIAAKDGFPYLSLSQYRDFSITGNRRRYEDIYFSKRRNLSRLVLGECVANDGRYIESIENGIWALLSEPSWTVPAHNLYIRDTKQIATPILSRPVLDLFSCETGEILALAKMVLKGRISKELEYDIDTLLYQRITMPYINDHFWWMGGMGKLNNWSPWCTQNVLIASLPNPLIDDKTRLKVSISAIKTLDDFIASYDEDGACDEGASYYHAAALAMFGAVKVLSKAFGDELEVFFKNKKIYKMASYIQEVHIEKDLYLNFADCSPKAGTLKAREFQFAKAVGNEEMAHHAALDSIEYGWKEDDNNYNLFYMLIAIESLQEIKIEAKKDTVQEKKPFMFFEKAGLAIYRGNGITFAIKGGCNGESHNHNDVGSIILYKDDKPLLIDIGVETYTKTTFSDLRYTLLPMQSGYHNVVNFPPLFQKDGDEYRATDTLIDEKSAFYNLTKAYPESSSLRFYKRNASFDRDNDTITIQEKFDSDNKAVLTLISQEKPEFEGKSIIYDSFSIVFDTDVAFSFETMEITDKRLRLAWPEKLYRTLIELPSDTTWKIRID